MAIASNTLLADLDYSTLYADSNTINENYNDSLRYWLNRIQTIRSNYDLSENYFSDSDAGAADNILETMNALFNFSDDQLQEYDKYSTWFNVRENVINEGRSYYQLNETELDELNELATNYDNYPAVLAQNFLCFYYGICFDDSTENTSGNRSLKTAIKKSTTKNNIVTVAPNPANDYAAFIYSLADVSPGTLTITDISGRIVQQFNLKKSTGEVIWQTTNVTKGLYFFSIKQHNKNIANGKVAVER